jgi:hypothetical protein
MTYTRAVAVAATDDELAQARAVRLTAHFTLAEFYVHELPPQNVQLEKLPRMAALAEWFRAEIARGPVTVKSYYRSIARNSSSAVDGAKNSPHLTGDGLDLVPSGVAFDVLAQRVTDAIAHGTAPGFGSMIFYKDEGHIHLSADGVPNGDHFRLLVSPVREDGAERSYIGFTTFAEFAKLWGTTAGKTAIALLIVGVLFLLTDKKL